MLKPANVLDVPYFKEKANEEGASPQCHEYVRHMLALQGSPATTDTEADCIESIIPDQPDHPMLPAVNELPRDAENAIPYRTLPRAAPHPKALDDLPDAMAELLATNESINVLMVETRDAKRFQLPTKDSIVSWSMLTHRVIKELDQDELLGLQMVWMGQPEDGNKTCYINRQQLPVDIRAYFLWSHSKLDPVELQRREAEKLQAFPVAKSGSMGNHPGAAGLDSDMEQEQEPSSPEGGRRDLAAEARSVRPMFRHAFHDPYCQA